MKVLFLANYFPRPNNPVMGTWALDQAQAFLKAGLDVRVVSPTPTIPPALARAMGASASETPPSHRWGDLLVDYPRWPLYAMSVPGRITERNPALATRIAIPFVWRQVERLVGEFRPDVVYAHHGQYGGEIARRLKAKHGLPYVVTEHDFEELESCATNPKRRAHYAAVVREASVWVAVSGRMEGIMRRIWPEAKTTVVYNGANLPDVVVPPRPPERIGKTIVASVGLMYPRKNMPLLIRAFGRARVMENDALLIIAGDGADFAACEEEVRRSPVADRIQLLGSVPHEAAFVEMAQADVFALVSRREPFGVAFTEAMSFSKPIVYTTDSGIAEVVRSGVEGIEVPPDDEDAAVAALDRMLADPAGREAMGVAARKLVVRELTWDRSAERMKEIFERAIAERA